MNNKANSIIKILGAILSIAIAAQLTIDIGSIPITGQTLAILVWAFFMKPKDSFIAIFLYLILGFCGLPIFADGSFGFEKLLGGSGGYLIGFLVSSVLVSYINDKIKSTSFLFILSLTLLGTIIILILGTGRLISLFGFDKGLEYGFLPFWKGAIIKMFIGTAIVWAVNWGLINKKGAKSYSKVPV